jgi:cytochrome c oxidase cbb3-type subunit 3
MKVALLSKKGGAVAENKDIKNKKLNKKGEEFKTTGHEWDGIQEYDRPDPLWLRYTFYAALFFSLGYWLLYPSWPSQSTPGALGWTEYNQLQESLDEIEKIRSKYSSEFDGATFDEIENNPDLYRYAIAGGRAAFLNNCAMCHGAGGNGNRGYPNLTAGAWLWGGKRDDIYQTIKFGIRSGHDETRDSQMAAFGRDGMLTQAQVDIITDFVLGMHAGENQTSEGAAIYKEHCAICHGAKGEGNREVGAPALNDAIWLYGGERETIRDVIQNGRMGVMPYWSEKLTDATIRKLTLYVHQLGGGE